MINGIENIANRQLEKINECKETKKIVLKKFQIWYTHK